MPPQGADKGEVALKLSWVENPSASPSAESEAEKLSRGLAQDIYAVPTATVPGSGDVDAALSSPLASKVLALVVTRRDETKLAFERNWNAIFDASSCPRR